MVRGTARRSVIEFVHGHRARARHGVARRHRRINSREERMRRRLLTLGILLLAACSSGDDGTDDAAGGTSVTLVGGQVVCDSCESVRLVLTGPGIVGVGSATLISSALASTTLAARINLDRESDAAGDRLVVTVFFDAGVPEGEFDLRLDPLTPGGGARIVPAVLRVTRARPIPGTFATVRVYVQVSGVDRDLGYTLRTVAGCPPEDCAPIPVEAYTGASVFRAPGTYTFRLDDVGDNCTLTGSPNPATLELQRGTFASLSYRLTCVQVANPGWVRVSNVTTGPEPDQDEEYQVACVGLDCRPFALRANRDTLLRLPPGDLTLTFAGVAAHCSLSGPATVALSVRAGDTASAAFPVACRERPGVLVNVRTEGRDLAESVDVTLCPSDYYSTLPCRSRTAPSNGRVGFSGIDAGNYLVYVNTYYLPDNCSPGDGASRDIVVAGSTVTVDFLITCRALGTVRISTVTTGTNQDASYQVVRPSGCDDYYVICERRTIPASGSLEFRLAPITQTFLLQDVALNCAVTTANPASVQGIEDGVVDVRFDIICR
jgi:hypothetical protein